MIIYISGEPMVKRAVKVVILSLLIILLISNYIITPSIIRAQETSKIIVIHAPAVSEIKGKEVGAILNITIRITPGTGKVFVSTTPLSMIDMQASAKMAVLVACRLANVNPFKYNFYFEINAPALIVGGPSAGAAITIGVFSLLTGIPLREEVMMTGMINPDGTIGPVGGIPTKIKAAAKFGVKTFLIPLGQRYCTVKKVETRTIGPIIEQRITTERVDVVEYGRKLGIQVIEVGSISEAIKYFTGYELPEPKALTEPKLPTEINEKLKENAELELTTVRSDLESLKKLAPSSLQAYLREANRLYSLAVKAMDKGDYYTSLSYLFNTKIHLYFVKFYMEIKDEEDAKRVFVDVEHFINETRRTVYSVKVANILLLEVITAASWRVRVAESLLEKAKKAWSSRNYRTALENLAFAYARAETALDWLKLIVPVETVGFNMQSFRRIVESYLYEARTVVAYAETIISEMGLSSQLSNLLSQAVDNLSWAEEALNEKNMFLTLEASSEAIVYATSALSLAVASREALQYQFEHSRTEALKVINKVLQHKITPLASVLYYMRAKAEGDPVLAIILYKMSAIHANTILSLLLFGKEGKTVVSPLTIPTKIIRKSTITYVTTKPIQSIIKERTLVIILSALVIAVIVLAIRSVITVRKEHSYPFKV